jgi:DNA-binding XRE family transcriptional regulator
MAGKPKNLRSEENLLLGRRLSLTRRAMNRTQKDFAAEAGVSPESYNQWEKGAVCPPPRGAIKLVKAHKLTLDWIYLAVPDRLPSWLAKAIEALGEAENAAYEAAEQERAQEVKIVRPKSRRHSQSAA